MIIGVDVGGTFIKAGVVDKGIIVKGVKVNTEANKGREAVLDNIENAVSELGSGIRRIGVGVPGMVDFEKGVVINCPNIPFKDLALRDVLEKRLNARVAVDNDANCFALAESLFGSAKGKRHVIGITLGTGFGGGIVVDGKVYRGRIAGGELGHLSLDVNGLKCSCGGVGCAEEYISARGIMRLAKGLDAASPLDVYELAASGNKKAVAVFEKIGFYIGAYLTSMINLLDPDVIVIGGEISNSWGLFSKVVHETIYDRCFVNRNPKIVKSRLSNSGVIGAAYLLEQK